MSHANPAALPEGAVFQDRYRIVCCIKAGGMGAVYECVHLATQKRRALKVMLPHLFTGPDMRERFELEARITSSIESEHIVETFDAGVDGATGAPFLVMELLRGGDLDDLMRAQGPFSAQDTVTLLSQLALALDRTHATGIVHRDLKPQNLFLTQRDDGSPRVKVLDFGIAKVVADGNKAAQQTDLLGTPVYMAPEQVTGDGHIGPPADLYALGHIAYTLLVGKSYWLEDQQELSVYAFLSRVITGAVEPASVRASRRGVRLPAGFDAWFARATAPTPGPRFERASQQILELAAALGVPAPRQLSPSPSPLALRLSVATGGSLTPAEPFPSRPGTLALGTGGSMAVVASGPKAASLRSRTAVVVAAIAATLAGAALGVFFFARTAAAPAASAGTTTSAAASPPAPGASATATAAAPTASASATASPTTSAEPESATLALSPATTPRPRPAEPAKPPQPPAPAPAHAIVKSCDPPFVVDAAGRHHMKPECL